MYQDSLKEEYLKKSNIPARYLKDIKLQPSMCDLDNFKKLNNIKNGIDKFIKEGYNLFIYSKNTGNGKTSWSCNIGKYYINNFACNYLKECPVFFLNVSEFLNLKKSAISNSELLKTVKQYEDYIYTADLVIWDDVAVKGLSDYDSEQLYTLINYRVANLKSNIFTANHNPNELETILGARIYSRVINNSINVVFNGSDRRQSNDIF